MSQESQSMSDAARELHNYGRVLMATMLTCIVGLIATAVTVSVWGGKLDQRVTTVEARVDRQGALIAEVDNAQRGMTGRLATIEERTGNIVKGLDRIENKVDQAVSGHTQERKRASGN